MSTVAYWLQKQRKPDLQNLAAHVGMKNFDSLLKTDLEIAIDNYLRTNQSSLQNDPQVSGFYKRIGSPVKRESGGASTTSVVEEVKKPKQRRQTLKAREELDQPSDTEPPLPLTTTNPQTPPSSTTLSVARRLPLPASPSLLADRIEEQTASLTHSATNLYTSSPIPLWVSTLRTTLSSTTSIQILILFLEAFGLFRHVLPLKTLTMIPPIPALGLNESLPLLAPDIFAILTGAFWGPVGMWVVTSILVPAAGAWFFNFRGVEDGLEGMIRWLLGL